jgi:RNA polymerase sigma-70 factor (ECF subfamily)
MRKHLLDDQELVNDYINGNEASFEILMSRHRAKVYSYIVLMIKDQTVAEDIFQDTFIKVIKTLKSGRYTEEGKFLPWVMRISHNLIIDHFRKAKRMPAFESNDEEFDIFDVIRIPDKSAEDILIKEQIHVDVRKLIELLPKEQKEVLFMRHYADMSFNEIAEQTQVSINTALGRMRYALINLRKLIDKHKMQLIE